MSHPNDSTSCIIVSRHRASTFQAVRYLRAALPPSSLSTQRELLGSVLTAMQLTTSSFSLPPRPSHLSPCKSQCPKGYVPGPSLVGLHQPFQLHLMQTCGLFSSAVTPLQSPMSLMAFQEDSPETGGHLSTAQELVPPPTS